MSLSFIEEMSHLAQKKSAEHKLSLAERRLQRKDFLYYKLTKLYHSKIMESIKYQASRGKLELYMNFNKLDFKANFPGLGNPSYVCRDWLNEICTPYSKYLHCEDLDVSRDCLNGLKFNVWNNKTFTVYFRWPQNKTDKIYLSAPPPSPNNKY